MHLYLLQITFSTPTAAGVSTLPEVPLMTALLPDVILPVDLLPPHLPDLQQLLPSEVTGGAVTLVAGIRVGNSTRQTPFHEVSEKREVGRKRGSSALTCPMW